MPSIYAIIIINNQIIILIEILRINRKWITPVDTMN